MLKLLREWYPNYATAVVAGALDLTPAAVYNKAFALDLKKNAEYLATDQAGRIQRGRQHPAMIATRFESGHTPWNKGSHFVAGGRSAETRFVPGQKPHTWVPIGSYRVVRGGSKTPWLMLECKVSDVPGPNHLRWHPVHRLVWEAANGRVPAGHIVVFRAGQRTTELESITLDRLECISRAENARRNHPRNKSPELARLVQLKGAITRQVNRIVREHEESASES